MTFTEYATLEQGTPAWHDQRRGIVTASVVGQLITTTSLTAIDFGCPECGVNPYAKCMGKRGSEIQTMHPARATTAREDDAPPVLVPATDDTARALTAILTAQRITGFTEETRMTDDMWRGKFDEPYAREAYAEHFAPVRETGFMLLSEDWGTLGFSPDGLVGDDGIIEIKSRRAKKQLLTVLSDGVPPENAAQIQAGLLVSGRDWCDFVSFTGGMHLYVKRVLPDPRWFDAITAAVTLFEKNSAAMTEQYLERVVGMPMTERIIELDMVI